MALTDLVKLAAAAELGLAATMTAAWAVQRRTGNSGWIDAFWTFGVGAFAAILSLVGGVGAGLPWRQVLVAILAALWSLRLGAHIVARTRRASDDPRYRQLMKDWGDKAPLRLWQFLQAQAAVGAVLVVAVALAARSPSPSVRVQDVLGFALLAGALWGESVADRQLARFKQDPANRGGLCDQGLWSRSRHPNYFFEWLIWLAYPIIAIDLTGGDLAGWLAVLAPMIMFWTLRYASGVPPLEEHMMRTRPEAFARYQAKTPVFFPRLF